MVELTADEAARATLEEEITNIRWCCRNYFILQKKRN